MQGLSYIKKCLRENKVDNRAKAILSISIIEKRYPPYDDDAFLDRYTHSDPDNTEDIIEFSAEIKYLRGNIKIDTDDPIFLKVKETYTNLYDGPESDLLEKMKEVDALMQELDP